MRSHFIVTLRRFFVLLGDFNARVGSRQDDDDEWWHERDRMYMEF